MWYLFFQMWLWLVIAFVLGWLAHWFLCCRNKSCNSTDTSASSSTGSADQSKQASSAALATAAVASSSASASGSAEGQSNLDDNSKPLGLVSAPANPDDLKRIKGIGAVNEKALNGLGIYTFAQIADWNADNISWVEGFLAFPGRIGRENWVDQSKTLSQGGTTSFANKVDSGKVDYDS